MARIPTLTTLFDSGINTFAKEWTKFSLTIIIFLTPVYLLALYLEKTVTINLPELFSNIIVSGLPNNSIYYALYLLISIIIGPIILITVTSITYHAHQKNKAISCKKIGQLVCKRFFPTIWTSILVGLTYFLILAIIATVLLLINVNASLFNQIFSAAIFYVAIIFAIIMGIYFIFSLSITILENISGIKALKKSINMVKKRWWSIFGRVIILQLSALLIIFIIHYFGTTIIGLSSIGKLTTAILQQIAIIPISIAMVVLYLGIRPETKKLKQKKSVAKKKARSSKTNSTHSNKFTGTQKSKNLSAQKQKVSRKTKK